MAAAVEVMTTESSPSSLDVDDAKEPGKRKRFFKNIRQLFRRKKNSKSKDGDMKAVSVANVSSVSGADRDDTTDDELDSPFPGTNGALSVSHDSVFSPEKPRDSNVNEMAKSMERLPQVKGSAFKSELVSKLQRRGGHPKTSQNEGLSESSLSHNTAADVLMENGLRSRSDRSYESDHSLASASMGDSSENELEEDFFKEKWASNSSLSKQTASPGSGSDLNLDIISSTASLNVSAAKHKIAIKQKGKRASALVLNRRRANSPKPPVTSMKTLLEEDVPPKSPDKPDTPSELTEDEQVNSTASLSSIGGSKESLSKETTPVPKIEEPTPDYDLILRDKKPELKSSLKPSPRLSSKKPQIRGPKPQLKKSDPKDSPKTSTASDDSPLKGQVGINRTRTTSGNESPGDKLEFTSIVLKKTSSVDKVDVSSPVVGEKETDTNQVISSEDKISQVKGADKKETEQTTAKTNSGGSSVILRQKSSTPQDISKRQTIAVSGASELNDTTPFGERKLNKRSSWIDSNRNWDDAENKDSKDKKVEKEEDKQQSGNEFTQMFNKFQRKVSQKKDVPVKVSTSSSLDDTKDDKPGANVTPKSVPSNVTPATSTISPSQVSSVSSKSVTIKTSSNTTSEPSSSNEGTTTTTTKSTSFMSRNKTGVQSLEIKPQPKVIAIEKPKSPNTAKELNTGTASPVSPKGLNSTTACASPEKKSGDFFPKKTIIIESKSPGTATQDSKSKPASITVVSTNVTGSSSSSPSVTSAKETSSSKTTFVFEKPTGGSGSSSNTSSKVESTVKRENDENTQPKTDVKSSSSVIYRRPSPIQKDRVRSNTLPEQPVLRQKAGTENNNSQNNEKDKITPSPTASPQRSKSMKPMGKTSDEIPDGRPSWVAMAKRKTVGWNSEDSNKEETKEIKVETKAPERTTISSESDSKKSIKDLMRKFQS